MASSRGAPPPAPDSVLLSGRGALSKLLFCHLSGTRSICACASWSFLTAYRRMLRLVFCSRAMNSRLRSPCRHDASFILHPSSAILPFQVGLGRSGYEKAVTGIMDTTQASPGGCLIFFCLTRVGIGWLNSRYTCTEGSSEARCFPR